MNEYIRTILALNMIPNIGAHRIRVLMNKVTKPEEIFRWSVSDLIHVPGVGRSIAEGIVRFSNWKQVDETLEKARKGQIELVVYQDSRYPDLLKQIYDSPVLLYVLGNTGILNNQCMAVVGTRKPTSYGRQMAEYFTQALVEKGLTVASGLAYGIDTIAHRKCLSCGGKTVAVLGSGIDWIYPESNLPLAKKIIETGGAIISEFPLGAKPDFSHFPVRNRIVSGLSLGTLVVESGIKGGSMITANLALDQNREVFVIPHKNTNQSGAGCNYLIKRGLGKLVQTADDLFVELPVISAKDEEPSKKMLRKSWKDKELNGRCRQICQVLENGPMHIDELCDQLNNKPETILVDLFELEMSDCIEQEAGKIFSLI